MLRRLLTLGVLTALASAPGPGAAQMQDCPRGQLDSRYCDRDSDLVADAPTAAREIVDPPVLIFAYTPVEDPAVYRTVWQEFMDHLARETGKRVQFFAVQSNAAQIEAMRAGRLHVAGFNTGSVPLAVNCAGFVPITMMASRDGRFGYNMEIIVQAQGNLQRIEDLRGRLVAFTAQTSNSGFKGALGPARKPVRPARRSRLSHSLFWPPRQFHPGGSQSRLRCRRDRELRHGPHGRARRGRCNATSVNLSKRSVPDHGIRTRTQPCAATGSEHPPRLRNLQLAGHGPVARVREERATRPVLHANYVPSAMVGGATGR